MNRINNFVRSKVVSFFILMTNEIPISISEDEIEYGWTFPKVTLAQYRKLKPYIKLRFFEVVECDGAE